MAEVYLAKDIEKIIEKIDMSRLGKRVGIKLHFGEKGCTTYIRPELVKAVYDAVIAAGKDAALIETNVLYHGERLNTTSHLKIAKEHGFDFAPIDILGGENGDQFMDVPIDGGMVKLAKIARDLVKYDSLLVLTHFKGHGVAGYGGVFKNIAMGLASRAGKLHMHSDISPSVNQTACVGCGLCVEQCDFDAIAIKGGKAKIDNDKCAGCAVCIARCPEGAVMVPWGGSSSENLQKKIVDYTQAVFKVVPQEKMIFINILEKITQDCDCDSDAQEPMMDDIGILLSNDPVAIDKASLDLVGDKFDQVNEVDKSIQTTYAQESGIGKKKYKLVSLN